MKVAFDFDDNEMPKTALQLSENPNNASFSSPGYYIITKDGAIQAGPFANYSLAIANLAGRDAIEYMDQPKIAPLNEAWPLGMNTVNGAKKRRPMFRYPKDNAVCGGCGKQIHREVSLGQDFWNGTGGSGSCNGDNNHFPADEGELYQKHVEKHSVLNSEKEGSMEPIQIREARLLSAMAKATSSEQRTLMSELEALRRNESLSVQASREITLADEYIHDVLTPVVPHVFHTASTDWLGGLSVEASVDEIQEEMITKAAVWYHRTSPEVKADRSEYLTQAHGTATRESSALGEYRSLAYKTFMDHIARMNTYANSEGLLPWSEVLPPVSPSEPLGDDYNTNHVPGPGNTGQPQPLSNDAEHAFLFEPDSPSTPEAMAQAGQVGQWMPNQDATKEPNDDGALGKSSAKSNPISDYRKKHPENVVWSPEKGWADSDDDEDDGNKKKAAASPPTEPGSDTLWGGWDGMAEMPQVSTGQTPEELAAASGPSNVQTNPQDDAEEPNKPSYDGGNFAAGMTAAIHSPWSGLCSKTDKKHDYDSNHVCKDCGAHGMDHDPKKTSSANFIYPHTTYKEYLSSLSEGGAPVSEEFFAGSLAASGKSVTAASKSTTHHNVRVQINKRLNNSVNGNPRYNVRLHHPDGSTSDHNTQSDGAVSYDVENAHNAGERHGQLYHAEVSSSGTVRQLTKADTAHPKLSSYPEGRVVQAGQYELTPEEQAEDDEMYRKNNPPKDKKESSYRQADFSDPQGKKIGDNPAAEYNKDQAYQQSGNAQSGLPLAPEHMAENFSNISDFPDTGPVEVPSNRAPLVQENANGKSATRQFVAALDDIAGYSYSADTYHPKCMIKELANRGEVRPEATKQHPESALDDHAQRKGIDRMDESSYDSGEHPKVIFKDEAADNAAYGESNTCGHCGQKLYPNTNHPPIRREGARMYRLAKDDDDNKGSGFETGGWNTGGMNPNPGLKAQSPKGQAKATGEYENAISSGMSIDWSGTTGSDNLGTVPVQGYEQNADHPAGEMFPYTLDETPVPSGAADVNGVPTPGASYGGYPQPNVPKNSSLDAFRARIH